MLKFRIVILKSLKSIHTANSWL